MASTKIKQIKTTNTHHTIPYTKISTIAKADKGCTRTKNNDVYTITLLNKDPTDLFQKQIRQALQKCSTLIE